MSTLQIITIAAPTLFAVVLLVISGAVRSNHGRTPPRPPGS